MEGCSVKKKHRVNSQSTVAAAEGELLITFLGALFM